MKLLKSILTVANSSLVVLIIFFFKINPIGWIEKYLPQDLITKLKDPTVRITINSAITLLVVRAIITLFSKPVVLNINLNNLDGTQVTDIPVGNISQKPKKLNLDIKVNYKNKFLKWLINILGGLYVFVDNTPWTSLQAEKKSPLFSGAIDDITTNEYISIKIDKLMAGYEVKNNFRINLNVLSNSPDPVNGSLHVTFASKNRNAIIKFLLRLFVSFDGCEHRVQSSREVI